MVKVISKEFIEINPGEVVVEITVTEKIFFFKFKRVFREVHGEVFRYRGGYYQPLCWLDRECKKYFKIPIDEN